MTDTTDGQYHNNTINNLPSDFTEQSDLLHTLLTSLNCFIVNYNYMLTKPHNELTRYGTIAE